MDEHRSQRPDERRKFRKPSWDTDTIFATLAYWAASVLLLLLVQHVSQPPFPWDIRVLAEFASRQTPALDRLFGTLTWAGSLATLIPASMGICAYYLRRQRYEDVWLLGLGLGGASAMAHLAKNFFQRPRPELFSLLGPAPEGLSFPSGHATQISAFMTAFLLCGAARQKSRLTMLAAATALALAVAASRVYLHVHYPSDVLAGLAFGMLWVMGLNRLLRTN